jgi:DNA polymerase
MVTEPAFDVDVPLLQRTLTEERARKRELLLSLTSDEDKLFCSEDELVDKVRATLASAPKFQKFLERCEVEVPMKRSPTDPNRMIPALAKTDEGFIALTEHDDPLIAVAARARLDVKSTLLETRIEKLLSAVSVCPGNKLPIPLKYYGAHTGRWSGEQYNPQNLPRVDKDRPKTSDALRYSLKAPPGYVVMVADQSGIELRVNHTLWRVPMSMRLYREDPKADLYVAFAARQYGIPPEQVDKPKRQLAKVAQLGLGFGAGAPTFRRVAKIMGKLTLTEQEAYEVVQGWRATYPEIVKGWYACNKALDYIIRGQEIVVDPGELVRTTKDGLLLPSGRVICYPHLKMVHLAGENAYRYGLNQHATYIYGGKVVENIVQALARDVLADVALTFFMQCGYRPNLMVHDELVYIVPEEYAQEMLDDLQRIMRTPPKWWPDLVVWSEGSVGETYGAAK